MSVQAGNNLPQQHPRSRLLPPPSANQTSSPCLQAPRFLQRTLKDVPGGGWLTHLYDAEQGGGPESSRYVTVCAAIPPGSRG